MPSRSLHVVRVSFVAPRALRSPHLIETPGASPLPSPSERPGGCGQGRRESCRLSQLLPLTRSPGNDLKRSELDNLRGPPAPAPCVRSGGTGVTHLCVWGTHPQMVPATPLPRTLPPGPTLRVSQHHLPGSSPKASEDSGSG